MGWVCRGQGLRESANEVQCSIAGGPGAYPLVAYRASCPRLFGLSPRGKAGGTLPVKEPEKSCNSQDLLREREKKSKRSGRVRRLNSRQLCSVSPIECRGHEKGYRYCTHIQPLTTGCTLITRCFISGGYKFFVLPCFTAVPK